MIANDDIQGALDDEIRATPWRFTLLGVLSLALGVLGLVYAGAVSITSVFVFGAILVASGIGHLYLAARFHDATSVVHNLPIGLLDVIVGAVLLTRPIASLVALTLVVAAFFVAGGAFRIIAALGLRMQHWGLPLVSGIFSMLLGLVVWTGWPASSFWLLGTYVSAYLIVSGATFLALGVLASRAVAGMGRMRPGLS